MKPTSKRTKAKGTKKRREARKDKLEDLYRLLFLASPNVTDREKLTMYKSVPTVTTYGLFEKPV
jgi:hypothetical protein